MKNKKGFTLAEVLITLGIIGIVAQMTIPSLVENTQNAQYVSRLKKTYSVLQQAFLFLKAEGEGDILNVPEVNPESDSDSGENNMVRDAFLKYLKSVKTCDEYVSEHCFAASYKYPDRSPAGSYDGSYYSSVVLADGSVLGFDGQAPCDSESIDIACTSVMVDLDGPKGKNVLGVDVFYFYMNRTGIHPGGSQTAYSSNPNACKASNTYPCAAKVLRDGKIPF